MAPTPRGRTLAYLRISLDTERSGSIDKQRARLRADETAKGRDPDAVVEYVDQGVSASRDVARPGRDALLRDVRSGDQVVCTRLDRLARNVRDLLDIVAHIQESGASVRFIDNDISTDGPHGRFTLTLLAAIAELEAGMISERRREALESFAKEGRHAVGRAPYGFQSVENPTGRGLVIVRDPAEAPKVREAVMRVLAGESQNQVRETLRMSKSGFHNLLENPRLAGMTPHNGGVVMVNGVPLVNPDAAILTAAEWSRLSAFLKRRGNKSWSRQAGFGRVLACGTCGERLYVNASRRDANYATYVCRKRPGTHPELSDGSGRREPGVSVMEHAANAHVESEFLAMWGDQPYRVLTASEDDTARREAMAIANVRIAEIERRLRDADRDTRRGLTADLMGAYDAMDDAEAIPTTRREDVSDTGQTIGAVWEAADTETRERIAAAFGQFVVHPGTRGLPIAQRVTWEGLTPASVVLDGKPAQVVLIDGPETTQHDLMGGGMHTVAAGLRVGLRAM